MKKKVMILALAAIMICGVIFTGCSTQTEKDGRYPRHRSYPRPGVSSLKGLLT